MHKSVINIVINLKQFKVKTVQVKCQILQHLCLHHYPYSNSVCSVTSGSPHSQEGNLDTEVYKILIMELESAIFSLKKIVVVEILPLYNWPILTLKVLCQAGPDIGDMELRRSMLEPEVAGGHLKSLLGTTCATCHLYRRRISGRPVRSLERGEWTWIISIRYYLESQANSIKGFIGKVGRGLIWIRLISNWFQHGSGSSSVSHLARQSLYQKVGWQSLYQKVHFAWASLMTLTIDCSDRTDVTLSKRPSIKNQFLQFDPLVGGRPSIMVRENICIFYFYKHFNKIFIVLSWPGSAKYGTL